MNNSTICPGILLAKRDANGNEIIDSEGDVVMELVGGMSDIEAFQQFSIPAADYIRQLNIDHNLDIELPKKGNLWRVGKIGKTANAKRVKADIKRSKAENLELYARLHAEGKELPLRKFRYEVDEEGATDEYGIIEEKI